MLLMKKQLTVFGIILVLLTGAIFSASASKATTLGYISLGDVGPFTEPALAFAEAAFNTTVLGDFGADLAQFDAIWWHEGDSDHEGLSDADIAAILDFTESGGGMLLTGAAVRYATVLGLEDAAARAFGPQEDDGSNVGITLFDGWMDVPLWDGLESLDGGVLDVGGQVQLNSTGYPVSGDYYDKIWVNFITVAHVWEGDTDYEDRIASFGYWESGAGKVFNMNWRLPNYHDNNQSIDNLLQVTENIIDWVGGASTSAAVEPSGKLTTTWGQIK
jgi:hypothetical protein